MKRQRGRGRKPGGGGGHHHNNNNQHQHPNRQMESNGPETKVRGPASHIHERYLQLARDATSSGDRVLGENYLQHADHYFRLWRAMQPAIPVQQQRFEGDQDYEGDDEGGEGVEGEGGDEGGEAMAETGDQPDVEFPPRQQQQGFERDGNRPRRGRGRRDRFRPEGEREGGAEAREGEGGDDRPREREERPQRAEGEGGEPRRERRPPRERDNDAGPEGFSNGPKPAFLRGGD